MKILLAIICFILMARQNVSAQEYTLPYPSEMPGSKFYFFYQIKENIDEIMYFGNFSKFTLHKNLSDKYLVEAKILFEYRQFLLGERSLEKSNLYFKKAVQDLINAESEGKNISEKLKLFTGLKEKHIQVLKKLKNDVPEHFEWVPENDKTSNIYLWNIIDTAIDLRQQ